MNLHELFDGIGDAIREKLEVTDLIKVRDFPQKIREIQTGVLIPSDLIDVDKLPDELDDSKIYRIQGVTERVAETNMYLYAPSEGIETPTSYLEYMQTVQGASEQSELKYKVVDTLPDAPETGEELVIDEETSTIKGTIYIQPSAQDGYVYEDGAWNGMGGYTGMVSSVDEIVSEGIWVVHNESANTVEPITDVIVVIDESGNTITLKEFIAENGGTGTPIYHVVDTLPEKGIGVADNEALFNCDTNFYLDRATNDVYFYGLNGDGTGQWVRGGLLYGGAPCGGFITDLKQATTVGTYYIYHVEGNGKCIIAVKNDNGNKVLCEVVDGKRIEHYTDKGDYSLWVAAGDQRIRYDELVPEATLLVVDTLPATGAENELYIMPSKSAVYVYNDGWQENICQTIGSLAEITSENFAIYILCTQATYITTKYSSIYSKDDGVKLLHATPQTKEVQLSDIGSSEYIVNADDAKHYLKQVKISPFKGTLNVTADGTYGCKEYAAVKVSGLAVVTYTESSEKLTINNATYDATAESITVTEG